MFYTCIHWNIHWNIIIVLRRDQIKKKLVLSVVKLAYKRCLNETEKKGMVLQKIKNLDE